MKTLPLCLGPALGGDASTITFRIPIVEDCILRGNFYVSTGTTIAADGSNYYTVSVSLSGTDITTTSFSTAAAALTAGTPRAVVLTATEANAGQELQLVLTETGTCDTSAVLISGATHALVAG